MLVSHQVQVQQPPGMSVLRRFRLREARTAPPTARVPTDPLLQRRGLDGLVHGTTTKRIGPGLSGEPRQVTPPIFGATWPGLSVELKHYHSPQPHRRRRHAERRPEKEMGRSGQTFDELTLPTLGATDFCAEVGQHKRSRNREHKAALLSAEDQLSAQHTPVISRSGSRFSVQTQSSARSSASDYTTTSKASAMPRRIMRNGTLFFDHRFDASGAAIKDTDGAFRTSPFNSISRLERSPSEVQEMLEIIRMCAAYQGGSQRQKEHEPEYYTQPLSPTGRFDPPVRRPEKRLPLGVNPP
eukprot:Tamp_21569.p1 GENE.Tamp_21569~~Tamp_21569.p1  ORF type:complete len:298 (+),score=25.62 Tamp_21569:51-944(+)